MARPNLFLDSSALFAGVISSTGASRALLILGEGAFITLTISEQVLAETERNLLNKLPHALPHYTEIIRLGKLDIVSDPSRDLVTLHSDIISHDADVPIVVAAMEAQVDYLVTLNRRHFIDDPNVAVRSGLLIGSPGDALAWVRNYLATNK